MQLGGGIRNEATIERLLALGVSRLVAGTAALKDPAWLRKYANDYRGIWSWDWMLATGWWPLKVGWRQVRRERSTWWPASLKKQSTASPGVYTDIARDGMMAGPNFEQLAVMREASPFPVIASGGVTTLDDVARLAREGTHGAFLGRTLYEGHIRLPMLWPRPAVRGCTKPSAPLT